MGWDKILPVIAGRPCVLDECVTYIGLEEILTKEGILWRRFGPRTKDWQIAAGMRGNEILLTRDMKFYERLKPRAILLPINNGHWKRRVSRVKRARKEMAKLESYGVIQFNIKRGMRMLFTEERRNEKGWKERIPI